jgi:hypothetical protein
VVFADPLDEGIPVDSEDRSGPVLAFEPEVWAAFIDGVKGGSSTYPGETLGLEHAVLPW